MSTMITALEGLIDSAKAGKLKSLFIAVERDDGTIGAHFEHPNQSVPVTLSGIVDWAKASMMEQAMEKIKAKDEAPEPAPKPVKKKKGIVSSVPREVAPKAAKAKPKSRAKTPVRRGRTRK